MNKKNNGEPAFPHSFQFKGPTNDPITGQFVPDGHTVNHHYSGADLRDYFATHAPAMPEHFRRIERTEQKPMEVPGGVKMETMTIYEGIAAHRARWAYEYADAMLAERAKP